MDAKLRQKLVENFQRDNKRGVTPLEVALDLGLIRGDMEPFQKQAALSAVTIGIQELVAEGHLVETPEEQNDKGHISVYWRKGNEPAPVTERITVG